MPKRLNETPAKQVKPKAAPQAAPPPPNEPRAALLVQVGAGDPIEACIDNAATVIEVDQIQLDSPALQRLRDGQIRLAAPLILQGKLIGLLNLGPRLYEQELSDADRRLLTLLANQAVPAARVAEQMRSRSSDAREREWLNQDLRVAHLIQEALIPRQIPRPAGWHIQAVSRLAEIVGGDFYDVLPLAGDRLAVMLGDVCSQGIPSALVMANARSILRAAARAQADPSRVLASANELLVQEAPVNMYVTCFYGLLEPASGQFTFANAGHPLPVWQRGGQILDLDATGMPLGLMPGMDYPAQTIHLQPGDRLVLYSDGVSEAHNPQREMAGLERICHWLLGAGGEALPAVINGLREFTGAESQPEDDMTLLALERLPLAQGGAAPSQPEEHILADFELDSQPGNERRAAERVLELVRSLKIHPHHLDQIRTAVAETALNAMEHGNHYQADRPTAIQVALTPSALVVRITDSGGGRPIPDQTHPDLEAKLAGLQSPRGWGLFLIRSMVDEMHVISDDAHHTVELVFSLTGEPHGSESH